MKESAKTVCFVVTAGVLGLAAIGNSFLNRPGSSENSELVGTPFYETFTSTEAARSLEVSAIDPETGALKRFGVKSDGDLWRIPTHYDYPAEAAARIAQTSASVMGLNRQAMVGTGISEFERFGVVDPLSDDVEDPETAGKRITLSDENGDPLVDYILGNEIEDSVPTRGGDAFEQTEETKDFYIRRADESKTFRVTLDIDLSTKFSDWIDPDLLRINRPDVTQVSINNYKIEERGVGQFGLPQLSKVQGDQLYLNRPSPADPWNLAGLDPQTEAIQTDRVNEILGVLDEMVIVGVRPKFKFEGQQLLTPELTPADIPEFKTDQQKAAQAYQALQEELMDKGFNLAGTQAKLELASENGELEFGTSKGMRYRLHIGGKAEAEDESIEIGSTDDKDTESESDGEETAPADDSNRFVYVRVTFDETLLGDRPTEPKLPEAPVKPEGYEPLTAEEAKAKAESESKAEAEGDVEAESETKEPDGEPVKDERNPQFAMYEEALAAFEDAKGEHEMNLTRFKQDNEALDSKIEEGKKLVDELNQRFGDWYYVISADNLNTIQSARADVIKPAEAKPMSTPSSLPSPGPDISFPTLPEDKKTFEPVPKEEAPMTEPEPEVKSPEETEAKTDSSDPKKEETSTESKGKEAPASTEKDVKEATKSNEAPAAEETKPEDPAADSDAKPASDESNKDSTPVEENNSGSDANGDEQG